MPSYTSGDRWEDGRARGQARAGPAAGLSTKSYCFRSVPGKLDSAVRLTELSQLKDSWCLRCDDQGCSKEGPSSDLHCVKAEKPCV